jgi:undecaprenyl-diphosphatase
MRIEVIIILALIQGITEFLPISSSGHLILLPSLTGMQDQGLEMDVAVHIGSLVAVVGYFRHDVMSMIRGGLDIVRLQWTQAAKLTTFIAIATIPVLIAGLILKIFDMTEALRSIEVIGWATIIFGIVLYCADKFFAQDKNIKDLTLMNVIYLGLSQAIALIPGTSRSGITMAAARFLSFDRTESARISMLMSIPTILAAGVLLGLDVYEQHAQGNVSILWRDLALGAVLSGLAAYGTLCLMMRWLKQASMTPFVIYRLCMGAVLLGMVYLG